MNKYQSLYSPNKTVTAAQYITELICERKARSEARGKDLPTRFWLLDKWAKYYKQQIPSANKLLKIYSDIAIIKALNQPKAKYIYSLRAPHLIPIIEEQEKVVRAKVIVPPAQKFIQQTTVRVVQGEKTQLSKLRELDDE